MPRVLNESKGSVVAEKVQMAESMWSRFWGLMGRSGLPDGQGLFLRPSSSIHTFFMRFPIDVIFVDKRNRVVKVVASMKPFRAAVAFGAHAALELAAGAASRAGVERGDVLAVVND